MGLFTMLGRAGAEPAEPTEPAGAGELPGGAAGGSCRYFAAWRKCWSAVIGDADRNTASKDFRNDGENMIFGWRCAPGGVARGKGGDYGMKKNTERDTLI